MTTYDDRLKPCPFCGSIRVWIPSQRQTVHCWQCGTDGPFQSSLVDRDKQESELILKWNTRIGEK
jgi:Lar family restriction alleviation protein